MGDVVGTEQRPTYLSDLCVAMVEELDELECVSGRKIVRQDLTYFLQFSWHYGLLGSIRIPRIIVLQSLSSSRNLIPLRIARALRAIFK
jgi:hypothetical protein